MVGNFEEKYAQYKELFTKVDAIESIGEIKVLFRQLSTFLARMEAGIGSNGAES